MWVFLLSILVLAMYFMMGDLVHQHAPGLDWLFPARTAAPAAVPSYWQLELATASGTGAEDYRLTLPGSSTKAGVTPTLVLTCVNKKFFAHLAPGVAVPHADLNGKAVSTLTFDGKVKKDWEQGEGGLLFPPNSVWFVERALAKRDTLQVTIPVEAAEPITAQFILAGLGLYSPLLGKCGVNLPVADTVPVGTVQPVPGH